MSKPTPGSPQESPGLGGEERPGEDRAPFEIVYSDEHLIVLDKAPGVVVHPARGHREDTLSQLLAPLLAGGEPERAGIVHRLDRDTSGLLVVARSDTAHRRLQAALAGRRISREYIALVEGLPPARSGTIEAPIGRDPRVRTRMTVGGAGAREARTHFTLERALPTSSLLRLQLDTGRTHQIRVHLRAIGHPVAGDPEYGTAGLFGLERQFLHAARLSFEHPITEEPLELSAPLPSDLLAALARAERISWVPARPLRPARSRSAALPGVSERSTPSPSPGPPRPRGMHPRKIQGR